MSAARNDRNTVQFGPSRTPQSYKLDRLEEDVKDLERETVQSINNTTQEITNYVDQSIVNITGNAELLIGTVVTYVTANNSGTVDIDGATVNFLNASSVRLEPGDTIILSANEDYPDPFAVGLVDRAGGPLGYDEFEFIVPSSVAGSPRTVNYQMGVFGIAPADRVYDTAFSSTNLAALTGSAAYDRIEIEDWVNGTTTFIPGVGGTLSGYALGLVASSTVVAWNSQDATALYYYYNGVVYTIAGYRFQLAGVNNDTIVATAARVTNPAQAGGADRNWVVEIDNTGTVAYTDQGTVAAGTGPWGHLWAALPTPTRFSRAGGGHIVIQSLDGAGAQLVVDGVDVGTVPQFPTQLPTQQISVSLSQNLGGASNLMYSDIQGDSLFWINGSSVGTGGTLSYNAAAAYPLSFSKMDLTNPGPFQHYPDILSTSGLPTDGEPINVGSMAAIDQDRIAVGGSIWIGILDPNATDRTLAQKNAQAAYIVTDGSLVQAFIAQYPMLNPATLLFPGNTSYDEGSWATVTAPAGGGSFQVIYRRGSRDQTIIESVIP